MYIFLFAAIQAWRPLRNWAVILERPVQWLETQEIFASGLGPWMLWVWDPNRQGKDQGLRSCLGGFFTVDCSMAKILLHILNVLTVKYWEAKEFKVCLSCPCSSRGGTGRQGCDLLYDIIHLSTWIMSTTVSDRCFTQYQKHHVHHGASMLKERKTFLSHIADLEPRLGVGARKTAQSETLKFVKDGWHQPYVSSEHCIQLRGAQGSASFVHHNYKLGFLQ